MQNNDKVIKSLPIPIIVFDNEYKAVIINSRFKDIFSIYGKNIRKNQNIDSIFDNVPELSEIIINTILEEKYDEESKFNYMIEDQTFEILITQIFENYSPQYCITFNNLSPEEELEEVRKKLISNVAHELRTPLTAISSRAELMAYKDVSNEEVKENSEVIYFEIKRLSKMVTDLLEISKFDQNRIILNKNIFNISDLIEEVEENFLKKDIDIDLTIKKKNIDIRADYDKLRQVIYNIVENAIIYTKTFIEIKIELEKDSVLISIKDDGIGLTLNQKDKIFNRFYRTDASRTRNSGGSGLGLSISKEIVEAHGGEIYVRSKYGSGTEFIINLKRGV